MRRRNTIRRLAGFRRGRNAFRSSIFWGHVRKASSTGCQAEMLKLVAETYKLPLAARGQRWRCHAGRSRSASQWGGVSPLSSFSTAAICKNRRSPPSIVFREQAALRASRWSSSTVSCRHQKVVSILPDDPARCSPSSTPGGTRDRIAILHEAFRPAEIRIGRRFAANQFMQRDLVLAHLLHNFNQREPRFFLSRFRQLLFKCVVLCQQFGDVRTGICHRYRKFDRLGVLRAESHSEHGLHPYRLDAHTINSNRQSAAFNSRCENAGTVLRDPRLCPLRTPVVDTAAEQVELFDEAHARPRSLRTRCNRRSKRPRACPRGALPLDGATPSI